MQASLRRLSKAKYSVDEAWYRQQGRAGEWLSQELSQISCLAVRRSSTGLSARSVIVVQLGVPIVESLRAGYIKPLDLDFYRSLSHPLVRALYRQLDALHFDETTENGPVNCSAAGQCASGFSAAVRLTFCGHCSLHTTSRSTAAVWDR